MRTAGFWVVLDLDDLSFLSFLFREEEGSVSFVAFTARRFFKAAVEECNITWSTLLYSSLYMITGEAGQRSKKAGLQITDRY